MKRRPKRKPFTSVRKIFHCKLAVHNPLFYIKPIYIYRERERLTNSFILVCFFVCLILLFCISV